MPVVHVFVAEMIARTSLTVPIGENKQIHWTGENFMMYGNRTNNRIQMALTAALVSTALLASGVAAADGTPSAQAISDAVSDHSYQGSMSEANSGFNEYYAPDGTIHGEGYTGQWTTRQGEMCFAYGEEPTCYGVSLDEPSMVLRQDGTIKGSGMLIQGNTVK